MFKKLKTFKIKSIKIISYQLTALNKLTTPVKEVIKTSYLSEKFLAL